VLLFLNPFFCLLDVLISEGLTTLNGCIFCYQNPGELEDWLSDLNPNSKEVIQGCYAVPSLAKTVQGDKFQFERLGNLYSHSYSFFFFLLLGCSFVDNANIQIL
jgi:tRNA synthetases class I (E and Q), anti-codon binding domain